MVSLFGLILLLTISCFQDKVTINRYNDELDHLFWSYAAALYALWSIYSVGSITFIYYVMISGDEFIDLLTWFRILYGFITFFMYLLLVMIVIFRRKCYIPKVSIKIVPANNNGTAIEMTSNIHQPKVLNGNRKNNTNMKTRNNAISKLAPFTQTELMSANISLSITADQPNEKNEDKISDNERTQGMQGFVEWCNDSIYL